MGEVLRAAKKEHAHKDIRLQMRKIGSVILTHREVSAQEAVFHLLGRSVLTTTASTPVNDPLGPAYCTRARTCRRELTEGKMYCKETEPGMSTTYSASPEEAATSTPIEAKKAIMSSLDHNYKPQVFFGKSSEDASEFLVYVERFSA